MRQIADLRQQRGFSEDTIDEIITDVIPKRDRRRITVGAFKKEETELIWEVSLN